MPKSHVYGPWPASGEIDIMESRGNRNFVFNGVNIGTQQVGSTLHFGPYVELNGYEFASRSRNNPAGYDTAFHTYQMLWTTSEMVFTVDGLEINTVRGPFWQLGNSVWKIMKGS